MTIDFLIGAIRASQDLHPQVKTELEEILYMNVQRARLEEVICMNDQRAIQTDKEREADEAWKKIILRIEGAVQ